jgi:hypothetical protein
MHDNFYFYATTVNIPMGFYTPWTYSHGLRIFIRCNDEKQENFLFSFLICNNGDMQQSNLFIFLFSLMQCKCRKINMLKRKIINAMLESKYR